ncbi:MAG TPA: YlxR family protein [Firmicutes bacterium]|nr:YlxR family protein [Bacillota bacterium]
MKARKIPLRSCVGCGAKRPKRELVRVVRTCEGQVFVDPTGKKSGRGAYICPSDDCLEKAVKSGKIGRALEIEMPPELVEQLRVRIREVEETARGGRGGVEGVR